MKAEFFCFCCMIDGENLSEMATSTFLVCVDGDPIHVLDVYLQIVNATAADLEGHQPKICDKCFIILESTYIFRQMTEEVFKDFIKQRQSDTNMTPNPVEQKPSVEIEPDYVLVPGLPENIGEGRFTCNKCDKSYRFLSHLKIHRESHYKRFKCPQCPAIYNNRNNLSTHVQNRHSMRKKRGKQVKSVKSSTHTCQQCNLVFQTAGGLYSHNRASHQNVRYACKFCDSEYRYMMGLWRHAFDHLSDEPFNCPDNRCNGFRTRQKAYFINHLKIVHHTKYQESVHGCKMSTKEIMAYVRKPLATMTT